jgi:arylsulfatase A-like enzyme
MFYPVAHASGSRCQPSLATLMTGLHLKDLRPGPDPTSTVSAVLPEWLPGFRWDGEQIGCQGLPPTHYLTIGAGKWQYTVTHRFPSGNPRHPFDREVGAAGMGPQARGLLADRLQDVKDFIECAACVRRCLYDPQQRLCHDDLECLGTGPCTVIGCRPPRGSQTAPDSCRLAGREQTCRAQPFLAYYNPFMPHADYHTSRVRPAFDRTPAVCAEEPYRSFSAYCRGSGDLFREEIDPHLDANGNGIADPEEARSGAHFDETLKRIARNMNHTPDVYFGNPDLENFASKADYLRWINTFDRTIDELVVHLRESGLLENTVILYLTDNGFGLMAAKSFFSEHGYRTPIVVWDPRAARTGPTSPAPGCTDAAGRAIPGCRNEFAHAVDVLATVRSAAGCRDDPASCPTPAPLPARGPDAYAGQDLDRPDGIDRACRFTSDARLRQCLFGVRKGDQGIVPYKGWYVLAEVLETAAGGRHHLCKLYRSCTAPSRRLHDLADDPNERRNLVGEPADDSVCAALGGDLERLLWRNVEANGWGDACFPPP